MACTERVDMVEVLFHMCVPFAAAQPYHVVMDDGEPARAAWRVSSLVCGARLDWAWQVCAQLYVVLHWTVFMMLSRCSDCGL